MILADTSVWIDHWTGWNAQFAALLEERKILMHSMIVGELAMGNVRDRSRVLQALREVERSTEAGHEEVLALVDRRHLYGRGVGLVDAHLLASALLSQAKLWSLDRRLDSAARELAISWSPAVH